MALAVYPFMNVFWTILVFFVWVMWFSLLFRIFADVFRRHDIGGGQKVLWLLFVILLPFLGVFVYLIAESKGMAERNADRARASQEQFADYVQTTAGSGSSAADQIQSAKQLLDSGAITQPEFDALKQKALA